MARESLTFKQRAFVEAYLANGFNGTRAAETAGYKAKSENAFAVIASQNLRIPKIAALIEARMKDMAMSADEAMARLSQHARGSLGDFIGLSESGLKAHPQAHLLKKYKCTRRYGGSDEDAWSEEKIELELHDPQTATLAILKEQHLRAGEATEMVGMFAADVLEIMRQMGIEPNEAVKEFEQMIREQVKANG